MCLSELELGFTAMIFTAGSEEGEWEGRKRKQRENERSERSPDGSERVDFKDTFGKAHEVQLLNFAERKVEVKRRVRTLPEEVDF